MPMTLLMIAGSDQELQTLLNKVVQEGKQYEITGNPKKQEQWQYPRRIYDFEKY